MADWKSSHPRSVGSPAFAAADRSCSSSTAEWWVAWPPLGVRQWPDPASGKGRAPRGNVVWRSCCSLSPRPRGLDPASAEEEDLDTLSESHVAEERQRQQRPVPPGGSATNPKRSGKGRDGHQAPTAMITARSTISGQLARLCRNGILLVRMMWMISVWVSSDSTNQPV